MVPRLGPAVPAELHPHHISTFYPHTGSPESLSCPRGTEVGPSCLSLPGAPPPRALSSRLGPCCPEVSRRAGCGWRVRGFARQHRLLAGRHLAVTVGSYFISWFILVTATPQVDHVAPGGLFCDSEDGHTRPPVSLMTWLPSQVSLGSATLPQGSELCPLCPERGGEWMDTCPRYVPQPLACTALPDAPVRSVTCRARGDTDAWPQHSI